LLRPIRSSGTYPRTPWTPPRVSGRKPAPVFSGCDISSAADREALLRHARERFSRLDLLVNNAGAAPRERRDILDATEQSFDELIGINLKGPHFLTQLAARWMLEQGGGRIVFITVHIVLRGLVNRAEILPLEGRAQHVRHALCGEAGGFRDSVFEIRPGIIRTDMIAAVEKSYEERIAGGLVPQRRLGEGADVAKAVRAIADGLLDYGHRAGYQRRRRLPFAQFVKYPETQIPTPSSHTKRRVGSVDENTYAGGLHPGAESDCVRFPRVNVKESSAGNWNSSYQKWMKEDVAYILTAEERQAWTAFGTDDEREQFIEQFWLRRDPTPDTVENEYKEEHYRRIAYANERFASGIPGWRAIEDESTSCSAPPMR